MQGGGGREGASGAYGVGPMMGMSRGVVPMPYPAMLSSGWGNGGQGAFVSDGSGAGSSSSSNSVVNGTSTNLSYLMATSASMLQQPGATSGSGVAHGAHAPPTHHAHHTHAHHAHHAHTSANTQMSNAGLAHSPSSLAGVPSLAPAHWLYMNMAEPPVWLDQSAPRSFALNPSNTPNMMVSHPSKPWMLPDLANSSSPSHLPFPSHPPPHLPPNPSFTPSHDLFHHDDPSRPLDSHSATFFSDSEDSAKRRIQPARKGKRERHPTFGPSVPGLRLEETDPVSPRPKRARLPFFDDSDLHLDDDHDPASPHSHSDSLERKFRCDFDGCHKTFKRSGHLKRHLLVHLHPSQRERYRCPKATCNKHYSTKYDLAAHMRQAHDGVELLRCTVKSCSRRFVRQESLDKHLKLFDHADDSLDPNCDPLSDDDMLLSSSYATPSGDLDPTLHPLPSSKRSSRPSPPASLPYS